MNNSNGYGLGVLFSFLFVILGFYIGISQAIDTGNITGILLIVAWLLIIIASWFIGSEDSEVIEDGKIKKGISLWTYVAFLVTWLFVALAPETGLKVFGVILAFVIVVLQKQSTDKIRQNPMRSSTCMRCFNLYSRPKDAISLFCDDCRKLMDEEEKQKKLKKAKKKPKTKYPKPIE